MSYLMTVFRDLYYQDPELYRNQRYIDGLIDTISVMLNVPRWHLHVVGLQYVSNLNLILHTQHKLNYHLKENAYTCGTNSFHKCSIAS